MSTMTEWTAAVCRQLGLAEGADDATKLVLDVTADVAHNVARPAAPLAAFLVGLAAAAVALAWLLSPGRSLRDASVVLFAVQLGAVAATAVGATRIVLWRWASTS
jgi:hypothetical protein